MGRSTRMAAMCVLVITGCGGHGSDGVGGNPSVDTRAPETVRAIDGARRGGTIDVLSYLFPTSMDPGNAYNSDSYALFSLMHRPLYSYVGEDPEPVPDLAAAPPRVARDGRSVTIRLRRGVRFAAPVDREVVADDVRNALERGFRRSVLNPYVTNYFGALSGSEEFAAGRARRISGIETPDAQTLVLRLDRPEARLVTEALAMPITIPVPPEVSRKTDVGTTSTYGRSAVPTGPYRMAEFSSSRIVLERNPDWAAENDFRPALPDRIVWQKVDSIALASKQVVRGRGRLLGPGPPPSPAVLKAIAQGRYPGQASQPQKATGYVAFALNTARPPLDHVEVRRAVAAAVDRQAILQAFGGPLAGTVATHFIPPALPGHEEAGGAQGPDFDWVSSLSGSRRAVAAHLRAAGHASGRHDGKQKLEVVVLRGFPFGPLLQEQLEPHGFRLQIREVAPPLLTRLCSGTRTGAHLCFLAWSADFADAQTVLVPPFHGSGAGKQGTYNHSGLRDPQLDAAMDTAREENDPVRRARAWAEVDRRIVELAAAVPVAWQATPAVHSKDVASVINPWLGGWDLNLTGLR